MFDVSTPYKMKHILGDHSLCEDGEDVVYFWKNRFFEKDCRVEMNLTIFKREKGGLYSRIVEEQTQYGYTAAALKKLLLAAGFSDIGVYGDKTVNAPTATARRYTWRPRKRSNRLDTMLHFTLAGRNRARPADRFH